MSPAEGGTGELAPVAFGATGVSKTFAASLALADFDLEVHRGEIHGLLGGNGSGKSTFIKILAGMYQADPGGTLTIRGEQHAADGWSPAAARAAGLHFVHQDLGVFPTLTVTENLALGRGFDTDPVGRIRWRASRTHAREVLARFHVHADPDMPVAALRPADRTMLAVARALQDEDEESAGILVLDEPTASLPVSEVDLLLRALRRHAEAGRTILYVSHRLSEVLSLADRVTVLRDGRKIGTRPTAGMGEGDLVQMIVGRSLDRYFPDLPDVPDQADLALQVRDLAAGPLEGIDLDVRRGEVVGVAGLLGSGRSELLRAIFGDLPRRSGEIRVGGKALALRTTAQAMRAGIALVPEDRGAEALFAALTVRENLSAATVGSYWRRLRLRHGRERRDARALIGRFGIRPGSDEPPGGTLSGGNQQKVVLARWLRREPAVLLLDEPTQGVDISARAAIYEHVRESAARGTAVLVVASDFDELAHVVDRAVVLRGGRIVAEVHRPIDPHRLTELSYLTAGAAQ
jgi:ribose transport system ATP-binding protein